MPRHWLLTTSTFTLILEATSDYVCMTDPAGTITYLNAAGRKLIGAPESQGAGKSAGVHAGSVPAAGPDQ